MKPNRRPVVRACVLASALATLLGCHASAPRVAAPARPPPAAPPPAAPRGLAPYDWRDLIVVPLGSVLKDVHLALHEVLLFRDESNAGAVGDYAECYAADAESPPFIGRAPDEYVLCFKQDRLSRIEASVRLTAAEGPAVFAAACADWVMNAASASAGCEGSDGATRFSGRLEQEAKDSESSAAEFILSITLDGDPAPLSRPQ